MLAKKLFKKWISTILSISLLTTVFSTAAVVQAADMEISVNATDGSVTATNYDGPQVKKIRVLTEGDFVEIYWDRYVDETEAVDTSNFILKNGDTTLSLATKGTTWTDTLYFDKNNQEVIGTSAESTMGRLDENLHMSSIRFYGTIDASKGISLEIKGDTIVDENGKSAQNALYTNIPYTDYYTRFVTSDTGIVVKSNDSVAYSSLEAAAEQIDIMLSKTETGIAENMADYGCSLAVYSPHQNVYEIPEHRYGFRTSMYYVEGYGGNLYNNCVSSIAEQNIIRTRNNTSDRYLNTGYTNENILIHEFGHCVRSVGMDLLDDPTLKNQFLAVYNHAKNNNLWPNTYAISNSDEFFATMCAIWFNVMSEASSFNDGTRSPINTRFELQQYDPLTYEFFAKIFPDATLPSPWNSNIPDYYHEANYNSNWTAPAKPADAENKIDLKEAIFRAKLVDTSLYAESAVATLESAVTEAETVYYDETTTQLEIDLAVAKITRVIDTLPPLEDNFAVSATATTSYVSSWESLAAVNDGVISSSYNPSITRYGSWGNNTSYETLTYTWESPVVLDGAGIFFWYDGTEGNYTSGGIKAPSSYSYEYLDADGNWQTVSNPSAYTTTMDTFNNTTFDEVTTTALRVILNKQATDSSGIGVLEWKVYGKFTSVDKSALSQAITNAEVLNEEDYTEESWTAFQNVLTLAKELNSEDIISANELDLMIAGLENAQSDLVQKEIIDENKVALKEAISNAKSVDTSIYSESAISILEATVKDAENVYYNDTATQLEIDLAEAKIARVIATLSPLEDNFAVNATASTSFVSSWESLAAVNDRVISSSSYNPSIARYGTWGNTSSYETITYTWENPVVLDEADIYLWYDGTEGDYTSGGIKVPSSYSYEYLDADGNWQAVNNPTSYTTTMDVFNNTTFDAITTTALRVILNKQTNDSNGVGVLEWKVYGKFASVDKTALSQAIINAEMLNEENYTEESWTVFQSVLALAKELDQEDIISTNELELMITGLENAQSDLVEKEKTEKLPYTDVAEQDWFYDAIYYNYTEGLMTGMTDTTFGPLETLSRAQLALILYRMEGTPEIAYSNVFSDVPDGQWFTSAVLWAQENGIVTGYGNTGMFGPHDNISREQIAVMMHRYAGYKNYDTTTTADLSTFGDGGNVAAYAETAMKWAVGTGIITGQDNGTILAPQNNALRAECAIIIQRFIENNNP